jgi:hypothetical protein
MASQSYSFRFVCVLSSSDLASLLIIALFKAGADLTQIGKGENIASKACLIF